MKDLNSSKLLPLSVAVLMGGESKRFGSPKAFLPTRGKSLACFLLEKAASFAEEVFAVSRDLTQVPPDAREKFPVTTDIWKEQGPLSGLHSALTYSKKNVVFLCGVDMPFLKREVVEGLFKIWEQEGRPDVVVPKLDGRWEPLCALWSKKVLVPLEPGKWNGFQRMLSEGPLKVREVTKDEMYRFDSGLECFRNFNTEQEWETGFPGVSKREL